MFKTEDFYKIEKIDAHVHINSAHPAFVEQALADKFKLLSINIDAGEFPPLTEQLAISEKFYRCYPENFAFASSFRMAGWDSENWQDSTIEFLEHTFERGAVAVKIWKNIGMEFRDENDRLIMIDDARFDPVFRYLLKSAMPLIGHLGEPRDCWLPVEQISLKYIRDYYQAHPQYHMHLHPELPSYEAQIAARDRMLTKHRQQLFIAVHLASLEYDIRRLAEFMDRYPNTVTDLAARMMYLQYYSSRDRQKIREFFIRYQDRILYGSDIIQEGQNVPAEFKEEIHRQWLADWQYLTTDENMQTEEFDASFQGLALPAEVIEKIYRLNALRIFKKAWRAMDGIKKL